MYVKKSKDNENDLFLFICVQLFMNRIEDVFALETWCSCKILSYENCTAAADKFQLLLLNLGEKLHWNGFG